MIIVLKNGTRYEEIALCDGAQSLTYDAFQETMGKIKSIADILGRAM